MKVLVIGGGGREHAIAWKIAQSEQVEKVYAAPGNAGMSDAECINLGSWEECADFAEENNIDLTVVGPEAPLCDGVVDIFRARNLRIFGPNGEAAQLEGSKVFAKEFMSRHGIPTAAFGTFTEMEPALEYLNKVGAPIVVKADGLAAGKGVIVAMEQAEAEEAIRDCFSGRFGDAGNTVLIEDCLVGEEASILALCDGETIIPLVSSQDHKRVGEGDTGPNTGGMGAYSPAPVVTKELMAEIDQKVLKPFLAGVQKENLDFRGVIYAGIMVTEDGPMVLEFNVRFGDPETQAVLARLDSDLYEAMGAVADQKLKDIELVWSEDPAVCIVLASGGYPGDYTKGYEITGLVEAEKNGAVVFHAGTAEKDGKIVNTGGRVLGVTARGADVKAALDKAYEAVDCISWEGCFCRRDIAYRAFNR